MDIRINGKKIKYILDNDGYLYDKGEVWIEVYSDMIMFIVSLKSKNTHYRSIRTREQTYKTSFNFDQKIIKIETNTVCWIQDYENKYDFVIKDIIFYLVLTDKGWEDVLKFLIRKFKDIFEHKILLKKISL